MIQDLIWFIEQVTSLKKVSLQSLSLIIIFIPFILSRETSTSILVFDIIEFNSCSFLWLHPLKVFPNKKNGNICTTIPTEIEEALDTDSDVSFVTISFGTKNNNQS